MYEIRKVLEKGMMMYELYNKEIPTNDKNEKQVAPQDKCLTAFVPRM